MKKALVALAAMAISTGAMAGPSYTYVDLGFIIGDGDSGSDGTGADSTGYGIRGSFGFANIWHVGLDLETGEISDGKSKGGADVSSYTLRGGIHPAVTDNTDFVLDIFYNGSEVELGGGAPKVKPTAYGVRTGVRSNIGKLELRGFVTLAKQDTDTAALIGTTVKNYQTGLTVGGQYNFSDAWSVGVDQEVSIFNNGYGSEFLSDPNLTNVYVRWSF